jgi:hypothetical protein
MIQVRLGHGHARDGVPGEMGHVGFRGVHVEKPQACDDGIQEGKGGGTPTGGMLRMA